MGMYQKIMDFLNQNNLKMTEVIEGIDKGQVILHQNNKQVVKIEFNGDTYEITSPKNEYSKTLEQILDS